MMRNLAASLFLALLLSACVSGGKVAKTAPAPAKVQQPSKKPAVRRGATPAPPPKPRILSAPGLEGVIGANPDGLIRQFGPARLDVWEGDARKLQFAGRTCVLDVFLYPAASGKEVAATYVETRRASDGQEVDRAACVASLRRK